MSIFKRKDETKSLKYLNDTIEATAQTILTAFFTLHKEHEYPLASKEDKLRIYAKILELRGYGALEIEQTLEDTQEASEVSGELKGPSLNILILAVILHEYRVSTGEYLSVKKTNYVGSTIIKLFKKRGLIK